MCGFFAQYNTPNLPSSVFYKILALSTHRGPDQLGYWEGNLVQMGFNRLAILDRTPAGHQPFTSPHGRYQMVFNGEIYNHQELRQKLPSYAYRGHSDTETIAYAIEAWGIRRTVEALDGMFALGIYDTQVHQLTLVRDFAGIKPIFYGVKEGQVVFASQYDQLKQHPLFREAPINRQVLKLYLHQHFLPAPFGLHHGIHQLLPGEIVTFSKDGLIRKDRYWELPTDSKDLIDDSDIAFKLVESALSESVNKQLVADVPIGAFLSGGVDSPLVCALAKRYSPNINVFSIGSDSKVHDESKRSAAYAKAIGLKQHLWLINDVEMLSHWEAATEAIHEPLADFSILPTYLVSKLAKKNATVILSGDGGDELFFGYERFWSIANNRHIQHLPSFLRKGFYGVNKYILNSSSINGLVTLKNQGVAHESLHCRFPDKLINEIAPDLANITLPEEWQVYRFDNTSDLRTLLQRMRHAEFYGMMQKTLRKVDLASMQNSVEVRVPFLQKNFIQASLQIDPLLNVAKKGKKEILKGLLYDKVPSITPLNDKKGFSVPLGQWMGKSLQSVFLELPEMITKSHECFDPRAVERLYSQHKKGLVDAKWPLFTLYALSRSIKSF